MASCPGPLSVFNAHSMQWMDASSGRLCDSLSRSLSTSIKSEMAAFGNMYRHFHVENRYMSVYKKETIPEY